MHDKNEHMKRTHRKRSVWIVGLALCVLTVALLYGTNSQTPAEPLADAAILNKLLAGTLPDPPREERHGEFHGTPVTAPALSSLKTINRVLGTTNPNDKRIEVDLSRQRVYAYQGNDKVYEFAVSTGKWGRTPTGTFRIWVKLKSTLMSGGAGADYYYLPGVPWVQFYYNNEVAKSRGFSIHGTYWHNNFGHPMSHGCVNMRTEDAATLFAWTNPVFGSSKLWGTYASAEDPGTEIVVYGETPAE